MGHFFWLTIPSIISYVDEACCWVIGQHILVPCSYPVPKKYHHQKSGLPDVLRLLKLMPPMYRVRDGYNMGKELPNSLMPASGYLRRVIPCWICAKAITVLRVELRPRAKEVLPPVLSGDQATSWFESAGYPCWSFDHSASLHINSKCCWFNMGRHLHKDYYKKPLPRKCQPF